MSDRLILAHVTSGPGPSIEFLILAAGLVILALMFFLQKTVAPQVPLLLLLVAVALGGGAFAFAEEPPEHHPDLGVVILSPSDDDAVEAGEPLQLDLRVPGGKLIEGTSSPDPNAGHLHLSVNGAYLPQMPNSFTPTIDGEYIEEGTNEITVEFVTANHRRYEPPVLSTVEVIAR